MTMLMYLVAGVIIAECWSIGVEECWSEKQRFGAFFVFSLLQYSGTPSLHDKLSPIWGESPRSFCLYASLNLQTCESKNEKILSIPI